MTSMMTTSADAIIGLMSRLHSDNNTTGNVTELISTSPSTTETSLGTSDASAAAAAAAADAAVNVEATPVSFFMALAMCVGAWGVGLFIIGGNLLIVSAVVQVQKLHTLSNMYIASLAVADCLVGVVILPLGVSFIPNFAHLFQDSYVGCLTFLALIYFTVACSGAHMLLVSVDRFLFLIHPFFYVRAVTERKVIVSIVITWCLAFLYGCAVFVFNDYRSVRTCIGAEILPASYTVYVSGGLHFVLTLVTSYVYFRIMLLAFHKWNASRTRKSKKRTRTRSLGRKAEAHRVEDTFQSTSMADSLINNPTLVSEAPHPVDNVQEMSSSSNNDSNQHTDRTDPLTEPNGLPARCDADTALNDAAHESAGREAGTLPDGSGGGTALGPQHTSAPTLPSSTSSALVAPLSPSEGVSGGSGCESDQTELSKKEDPTHKNGGPEIDCLANGSKQNHSSLVPNGHENKAVHEPSQTSVTTPAHLPSQPTTVCAGSPSDDLSTPPPHKTLSEGSSAYAGVSGIGTTASQSFSVTKDSFCSVPLGNTATIATSVSSMTFPGVPAVRAEASTAEIPGTPARRLRNIDELPPPPAPPPPRSGYKHGDSGSSPWKAVRLFLSVFLCFSAFWLPYYVYLFVRILYNLPQAILDILVLLGLLNSGVNFIVCAMISRDFRAYFKRRLCRSSCCSRS